MLSLNLPIGLKSPVVNVRVKIILSGLETKHFSAWVALLVAAA